MIGVGVGTSATSGANTRAADTGVVGVGRNGDNKHVITGLWSENDAPTNWTQCGQSRLKDATEEITCRRRLLSSTRRRQNTLRMPRITTQKPPSIMRLETMRRRPIMLTPQGVI